MRFGYVYDFTTLFLFTLSLLIMSVRRWDAYLLVFALATLNKETSVFLVLIFGLYFFSRLPRRQFLLLSIVQLGLYGVIQAAVRYTYRANPGTAFQWHVASQLEVVEQALTTAPATVAFITASLVALAALIMYGWTMKPPLLRAAIWILPFFLLLYAAGGYPGEIRAMLEVYPILALLIVPPQLLLPPRGLGAAE
jgi:hypothetical protein